MLAFLGTGQYMDIVFDHNAALDMPERLFYRSRHIYILGAATTHLALGAYLRPSSDLWFRRLQLVGSLLLIAASPLLVAAFFTESTWPGFRSPVSQNGLYAMLGGTLLHVLIGVAERFLRPESP